jgi:endonuclease III
MSNINEENEYYVANLIYHLAKAGMVNELGEVFNDIDFLTSKIDTLPIESLIQDYKLALATDINISEQKKEMFKLCQSMTQLLLVPDDELHELFNEINFLTSKIDTLPVQSLIQDYELVLATDINISEQKREMFKLFQSMLRLTNLEHE